MLYSVTLFPNESKQWAQSEDSSQSPHSMSGVGTAPASRTTLSLQECVAECLDLVARGMNEACLGEEPLLALWAGLWLCANPGSGTRRASFLETVAALSLINLCFPHRPGLLGAHHHGRSQAGMSKYFLLLIRLNCYLAPVSSLPS